MLAFDEYGRKPTLTMALTELWDGETGNRVGKYPTEEAALRAVLEDIRRYERDSEAIVNLGLLRRDPDRRQDRLIADCTILVERALVLAGIEDANGAVTTTRNAEPTGRTGADQRRR